MLARTSRLAATFSYVRNSTRAHSFTCATYQLMKQLLLLGGSLLGASAVHAQAGLRAGGSLSGYSNNTNNYFHISTDARLGYQVAVFYQLPLTKRLSLHPKCSIAMSGLP